MNHKSKLHSLLLLFVLFAPLVLLSCGKKPEETATAPSTPPAPVTAMSPAAKPTSSPASGTAKASTAEEGTLSAAAQKLGTKPANATTCPNNAPIKGKVTKKRGDIYHAPKTSDYDKVKPDICFSDTATAQKAGFRAPKQS